VCEGDILLELYVGIAWKVLTDLWLWTGKFTQN